METFPLHLSPDGTQAKCECGTKGQSSSIPEKSVGVGRGGINWVNWDFCKRDSHQSHTIEPIPTLFSQWGFLFWIVSFENYDLHNDFLPFFLLFLLPGICSLQYRKACSLISFWGMCSLTIYLEFHRLSATNNPYSLPCFIFLHCADCHLTWIHLTYLLFSVPLAFQNVKAETCIYAAYCYFPQHPGQRLVDCRCSVNTYQMNE